MSHFAVLVIGDNPEEQLEPFSENLEVPEYESDTVSQEEQDSFLQHYREKENVSLDLTFEEVYALKGEDWNRNRWRLVDGVWKEFSTYNPKSKWDRYSLGGRWHGYFKLLDEAGSEAGKYYDRFWALVGDQPLPNWKEIRERHGQDNIDAAREEYRNDPVTKILNGSEEFRHDFIFDDIMKMAETRGDYVEQARRSRVVTFAVLQNGNWYQRGEMGWWGVVSNEKDKNEWENQFYELLKSLPEDTLLSVYDCHI